MRAGHLRLEIICLALICACGASRPAPTSPSLVIGEALEVQRCEAGDLDYMPWVSLEECFVGELRVVASVVHRAAGYSLSAADYAELFAPSSEGATFGRQEPVEPFDITLEPWAAGARIALFTKEFEADSAEIVFSEMEIEREGDRARVRAQRMSSKARGRIKPTRVSAPS